MHEHGSSRNWDSLQPRSPMRTGITTQKELPQGHRRQETERARFLRLLFASLDRAIPEAIYPVVFHFSNFGFLRLIIKRSSLMGSVSFASSLLQTGHSSHATDPVTEHLIYCKVAPALGVPISDVTLPTASHKSNPHPHFTGWDTEVQIGEITCSETQRIWDDSPPTSEWVP